MEDKIYLFTTDKGQCATAQMSQLDAESQFQSDYGNDIDYTIKEIELAKIMRDESIEWF
jgi:hypothetical protein